jgi:palmitoyltransferase
MRNWREELELAGLPEQSGQLSFLFVLTSAVILSLGILLFWHVYLIGTAQTTIEFYKNMADRSRAKKTGGAKWVNQYSTGGWKTNYMLFFGLSNGRSWTSLLWPSGHHPTGDGLHWDHLKPKSNNPTEL